MGRIQHLRRGVTSYRREIHWKSATVNEVGNADNAPRGLHVDDRVPFILERLLFHYAAGENADVAKMKFVRSRARRGITRTSSSPPSIESSPPSG
jgi:hypothetical protein